MWFEVCIYPEVDAYIEHGLMVFVGNVVRSVHVPGGLCIHWACGDRVCWKCGSKCAYIRRLMHTLNMG